MNALAPLGAQPPPQNPDSLVRSILAQQRFHLRAYAPPPRTWFDVVRDWFNDRWSQIVDALSHHVRLNARASIALGDILLAAIVLAVVAVLVRLLLNVAREQTAPASGKSTPLQLHADARALYAAACSTATKEGYAAAIALLFQAALAALDAHGVLRDDPARTVNECRRDVRGSAPRLSGAFDGIARAFTAAVYAEDRASAEDWAFARAAYEALTGPQSDAA